MKIVALDLQTLFNDAEDPKCFEHNYDDLKPLYEEGDTMVFCSNLNLKNYQSEDHLNQAVKDLIKDADVVITNKVKLNKHNLNSHIKLILVAGTGMNNICFEDVKPLGIRVQNAVAYGINSVVQHTMGLILSLINNITVSDRHVRSGDWESSNNFCLCKYFFPLELASATLGIIGYGAIGKGVEKIAKAMGMRVLIADHKGAREPREGRVSFDEVLTQSDIISLHCPLNEHTLNLITAKEIALMKPTSYVINVARGGVVNEEDLYYALKEHKIMGAATDVLTTEPPSNNILLKGDLDNLIVTPHIAWGSYNARKEIIRQMSSHIKELKQSLI